MSFLANRVSRDGVDDVDFVSRKSPSADDAADSAIFPGIYDSDRISKPATSSRLYFATQARRIERLADKINSFTRKPSYPV